MRQTWLLALILLLVAPSQKINAQTTRSLLLLKPVSGNLDNYGKKGSILSHIFQDGLWTDTYNSDEDGAFSVYDLEGKFNRFQAWVGIPDGIDQADGEYSVRVDGKLLAHDTITANEQPVHLDLDISGAKSLRIWGKIHVIFADPVLIKGSPVGAIQPAGVASLVAPKDGVKVISSSVSLLWAPVDGATSYGVEIVCTKGAAPGIYALNVTESTAKFDLTGRANGEYHWSVIAFNGSGVMGKFSKDRTFIVAR